MWGRETISSLLAKSRPLVDFSLKSYFPVSQIKFLNHVYYFPLKNTNVLEEL